MKKKAKLVLIPVINQAQVYKPYLVCNDKITESCYFYHTGEGKIYICAHTEKGRVFPVGARDKKKGFFDPSVVMKVIAMPSQINLSDEELNKIVSSEYECFVEVETQGNPMENPADKIKTGENATLWSGVYKKYQQELSEEPVLREGKVIIYAE